MHQGTFKTGTVSRTHNQKKWHVSQISKATLSAITYRFHQTIKTRGWKLSQHLQKKANITFSPEIIQRVLSTGDIIEYNETQQKYRKSRRILLRNSHDTYKINTNVGVTESNLCVVVDIDSGDVITAYWNAANDNHKNINMRRYERTPLKFI